MLNDKNGNPIKGSCVLQYRANLSRFAKRCKGDVFMSANLTVSISSFCTIHT